MKRYKILKVTLTALILSGILFSTARDSSEAPAIVNLEQTALKPAPGSRVVKALIVNGEVYPMIELPVVEITGEIQRSKLLPGEVINGEIVPSVLLDEIVITPNS